MKRLILAGLIVLGSCSLHAEVKCSGTPCVDSSGVVSPVTTDPLSFSGAVTFNNAANTPLVCSDGLQDSTLNAGRVTFAGASGRLSDDADLTFATDTLSATKVSVKAGSGSGTLSAGGVLCKGAPAQATAGTSEEILATCTVPANTLSASGSGLQVRLFAHTAANANNKQIKIRVGGIGGTTVFDSAATASNNQNWSTTWPFSIQRIGAATATVNGSVSRFNDSASSTPAGSHYATLKAASITWANANDLVITGTTPSAAGDLTLDSYIVEVAQ